MRLHADDRGRSLLHDIRRDRFGAKSSLASSCCCTAVLAPLIAGFWGTAVKKLLTTVAVLTGTVVGSVGGYVYHGAESSPAFLSLSTALELVTGREAKAQADYEAAQGKLAVLQEEVQAQEEKHRKQLAAVHGRRQRAEC